MGDSRKGIIVSGENKTDLINYDNGNTETRLTISETYLGGFFRSLARGVYPDVPNVSGVELEGDFNSISNTIFGQILRGSKDLQASLLLAHPSQF